MEPILKPRLKDDTLKLVGRGDKIVLSFTSEQVKPNFVEMLIYDK